MLKPFHQDASKICIAINNVIFWQKQHNSLTFTPQWDAFLRWHRKWKTVMPHKFSYSIYKMSIYKMSTWISLGEKTSNEDGREEGLDDITYCFKVEKRVYSSRVHFIVTLVHVTSEFCSPFRDPNCYDCRQQYKTELRETTKEHATTTFMKLHYQLQLLQPI